MGGKGGVIGGVFRWRPFLARGAGARSASAAVARTPRGVGGFFLPTSGPPTRRGVHAGPHALGLTRLEALLRSRSLRPSLWEAFEGREGSVRGCFGGPAFAALARTPRGAGGALQTEPPTRRGVHAGPHALGLAHLEPRSRSLRPSLWEAFEGRKVRAGMLWGRCNLGVELCLRNSCCACTHPLMSGSLSSPESDPLTPGPGCIDGKEVGVTLS